MTNLYIFKKGGLFYYQQQEPTELTWCWKFRVNREYLVELEKEFGQGICDSDVELLLKKLKHGKGDN